MASVRKRKHIHKGIEKEAWVLDYVDQSGKRRLKTFAKKRDAEAHRIKVENEIDQGIHTPEKESIRLGDLCDIYVKDFEDRWNAKEITGNALVTTRAQVYRHIVPALGRHLVRDITREMLEVWVRQMRTAYAPGTSRRVFGVLRQIFRFGVRRRFMKRSIIDDDRIKLPAADKRKGFPTRGQVSQLLSAVEEHGRWEPYQSFVNNAAVAALGVFCGLRPGEACGLQWRDVDTLRGEIAIRHSYSRYDGLKAPKTKAGERKVPLTPPVLKALERVARWRRCVEMAKEKSGSLSEKSMADHRKRLFMKADMPTGFDGLHGHVLLNEKGGPVTPHTLCRTWHKVMKRASLCDAAGKPLFTPHMLRHVAASLFIEAGLPAMNIKKVMGHANVSTTFDVYGHLFPDDDRISRAALSIAASFDATRVQLAEPTVL